LRVSWHDRFHDLRYTFGTILRHEGRSDSDIAAILGITEAMAHVYAHETGREFKSRPRARE
jgi:predicted transcriptional regulator